jgi:hypothetical protein
MDRTVVSFYVIFEGLMTTGKKEYVSNHDEWKRRRSLEANRVVIQDRQSWRCAATSDKRHITQYQ